MELQGTPKRQTVSGGAAGVRCSIRMVRRPDEVVLVYEPEETLGKRELVFETPQSVVRIEGFPVEWRTLSDDELMQLRSRSD